MLGVCVLFALLILSLLCSYKAGGIKTRQQDGNGRDIYYPIQKGKAGKPFTTCRGVGEGATCTEFVTLSVTAAPLGRQGRIWAYRQQTSPRALLPAHPQALCRSGALR